MGLKNEEHQDYQAVHKVIHEYLSNNVAQKGEKGKASRKSKSRKKEISKNFSLKNALSNSFYSENIKLYH